MRKSLLILLILIFITFPTYVFAYDYQIDSYNVNINVAENNILHIKETISTNFNVEKHGIYRKIPLQNKVVRLNGTTSYNSAKITDIYCSEQSDISNQNGYKVIKIGNPNVVLTGPKQYTIQYSYNLGKDTGEGYDELYFNIIGNEWDTTINNISFEITMPKEFDKSKLGFSSGEKYSNNNSNISYNVSNNKITGRYLDVLYPGQALTIRLELPEGYFIGDSNSFDYMLALTLFFPIIFVIISFLLWNKYGKDTKIVETVEFYPPNGFNSVDIGFLYNGISSRKDVVSLMVYLANKGYMRIEEIEENTLFFKSKSFKLIKLKEYDGNNLSEKIFLNGLFKDKDEVTRSDLTNNFYNTTNEIMREKNSKENMQTIFEKSSFTKSLPIIFMIIVTFLIITIIPLMKYGNIRIAIFTILSPAIGLPLMFGMLLMFGILFSKSNIVIKIFIVILGLCFGAMPWAILMLPSLLQDKKYLVAYFVGIICVIAMILFMKYMPKRTAYGNEILGKIKGFKNFIEMAEKPKLEEMVIQDPSYFYDILPYAYVLGVSSIWIEKFESISYPQPNWYTGGNEFNAVTFMSVTMASAMSSMTSSPSSSSGGGSGGGGGGFSGGGSGGGGGGSW